MKYQIKRDVIIGMSDGLIIPFALSAGLSNVTVSSSTILLACLAQLTAGAVAMGFSGYHTTRTEEHQSHTAPDAGHPLLSEKMVAEKRIFAEIGLPEEEQTKAAEGIIREKQEWKKSLSTEDPAVNRHPSYAGLVIGFSYLSGGLIPLIPYMWHAVPQSALLPSAIITLAALFILGYQKHRLAERNPWSGAIRMMMVGIAAAAAAVTVSLIFVQ